MLHNVAKQMATIEIACIDASTKMPKEYYLLVDSIDVDTLGTVCKRRELKEENGVRNKAVDWIFKVKGRKDVWITLCVIKYVKHVELLNFDKPILIGSAVYNEETQW